MATTVYKHELEAPLPGAELLIYLKKALCYWELVGTLIVLTIMGAVMAVLYPPLFFFPFIGTIGALVALPELRQFVVESYRLGQERQLRVFLPIAWPYMCRELGWTQNGGTEMFFIPELIDVVDEPDGSGRSFLIRPLATQKPNVWPQMAEQLTRHLGAPNSTWVQVEPGVLKITAIIEDLPDTVRLEDEPAVATSSEWDRVELGKALGGAVSTWVPSDVPHLLVAGSTNSGKGSVLRLAALHGIRSGWQVLGVNPRLSGEFAWMRNLGVPVVSDLQDTKELLTTAWDHLQRRQLTLDASGVSSWRMLRDHDWAPVMIIVDEAATLLTPNKANKQIATLQQEIGDLLARIAAIGRACGFHLVMATQRPDAAALGPAGGALRNNVEGRVAVGSLDADGLRMMFGSADPDIVGKLNGMKGRALASKLSAGSVDVDQLQLFYVSEQQLFEKPPRPLRPQGNAWLLEAGAA